jgi:hypothetical protein
MWRRAARGIDDHGNELNRSERGATMVIMGVLMVVLIGMAGFAVDLGWLFLNATQTLKAAEAGALAGVVHTPIPSGVAFNASEAHDTAIDVVSRHGYVNGPGTTVTPNPVVTHPNRLSVTIDTDVDTFFMRVFGFRSVSISKSATAETLPPLKLGSDDSWLGEDPGDPDDETPDPNRDDDLWLAVNGDRTPKGQGDPFTPECYGPGPGTCNNSDNVGHEFRSPSYWYAFEVPQSHVGDSLEVEIWDPSTNTSGITLDRILSGTAQSSRTIFRLFEPDQTPNDPTDNAVMICEETFFADTSGSYDSTTEDDWITICGAQTAKRGIYVLEVEQIGDVDILNGFSLRAEVNGNRNNDVSVYGIGAMSLWTPQANSTPTFKLVRLDEIYRGTQLIISLWDVGDIGQSGRLDFMGSLTGIECEIRERDHTGATTANWHADDGGGSSCRIDISVQEHNNEWLDFKFDVPANYTCPATGCWATVRYGFSGTTTDRTTWSARINGGPIHLTP